MAQVWGAVLAAGSGSRMGTAKGELVVGGERLLDRAVRSLCVGGCEPVLAVVRTGVEVARARAVVNPNPSRGQRSSLELAILAADGADALAVLLVDMPGVGASAVQAVVSSWRPGRIALGRYPVPGGGSRRGHPTVMDLTLWRAAVELAGPDDGARRLLATRPHLIDEIDVAGDPADLDTPDDLARWTERCQQ